jgi:hypothetical protein
MLWKGIVKHCVVGVCGEISLLLGIAFRTEISENSSRNETNVQKRDCLNRKLWPPVTS